MGNEFPEGFLWGASTSSHQVEGHNRNSDWWDWEQQPGRIRDGSTSGAAVGWWHGAAESDLRLAAELDHNAHRLSLEWSRIEPALGEWDDTALDRYGDIVRAGKAAGLAMMVTLHHFTLPRWAAARGGWLWDGLPEQFARYAARCVDRLGAWVDLWATINEPQVLALMGYAGRRWPPGHGRVRDGARALRRMLDAHGRAYQEARACTSGAKVGIVLNLPLIAPFRERNMGDRLVARANDWIFSGCVLEALASGVLWPPLTAVPMPVSGLRAPLDFIGLNYYGRHRMQLGLSANPLLATMVQDPSIRTSWTDWGEVFPEGLTRQLLRLGRLGVPIYVTENGIFDNEDRRRGPFLLDHVRATAAALAQAVDVRGYFHWSLVDNFEWAEGWSCHFGLIHVDRSTGKRTAKNSARLYAAICRANGVPQAQDIPPLDSATVL